jgi:hypothetical protein
MDLKQTIGQGIIAGGAVGLVSLATAFVRWTWIGMRTDWQTWRKRRETRRVERLSIRSSARTEPPLRR